MSVRVADGLRSKCRCQPHDLARDVLFCVVLCCSINSRTESQKTSSISKPAVKGVSSLAFLSKSRSTQCSRQVNPPQPVSQHLVRERWEGGEVLPCIACCSDSKTAVYPPAARGYWHLRQRWRCRDANANGASQSKWQLGFRETGNRKRLQREETATLLRINQHIKCHFSQCRYFLMYLKHSHEFACLDVPDVYYELHIHDFWREAAHANPCSLNSYTHVSHSISHFWPVKFTELILRTCDCVHGLYYRCTECYRLWITTHWVLPHLFRRTCYVFLWEICAIFKTERFAVMIEQRICIYSIVSEGIKLYFYDVSLYTCIYVLNVYIDMRQTVIVIYVRKVYIVLNANRYMKHRVVHDQLTLLMMFMCMRLSGCNAWNCHK